MNAEPPHAKLGKRARTARRASRDTVASKRWTDGRSTLVSAADGAALATTRTSVSPSLINAIAGLQHVLVPNRASWTKNSPVPRITCPGRYTEIRPRASVNDDWDSVDSESLLLGQGTVDGSESNNRQKSANAVSFAWSSSPRSLSQFTKKPQRTFRFTSTEQPLLPLSLAPYQTRFVGLKRGNPARRRQLLPNIEHERHLGAEEVSMKPTAFTHAAHEE
ncbi:hypothetical protein K438DRAFT_444883 [Mycena galopus ATCC 62051]|nr:hypothetical protein K438DRAFT_444883 [Mycena galopus ATCC 62051]